MLKKEHYIKIKKIIFISMILVPAIPFISALSIGYYYFTTSLEDSTISSLERIVGDHGHMIDAFLNERKSNIEFILHSYELDTLTDDRMLQNIFKKLKQEFPAFIDLGIFNKDGIHIAYHGPYELIGKDYGDKEWFKEVMEKEQYISDIFLGYRKTPHFIIALKKNDKKNPWVIRATIDTFMFNKLVKEVRIGKTGEAYIINKDGILQTEPRSGGILMEKPEDNSKYLKPHTGINILNQDKKYVYATTWLKNNNWMLIARQEKSDAFKAVNKASKLIIYISITWGICIIFAVFLITERIIRLLKNMDMEKEQLNQQLIGASRLAELGEMAAGFAHEINNPLQIIQSEQSLMELNLSELIETEQLKCSEFIDELKDSIKQIKLQIFRCSKITQQILKFGRQSEPEKKEIDLKVFIPEIIEMISKKAFVHGIEIKQNIALNITPVYGDTSQLQQVLLNLFNNAIDAILERHGTSGGKLIVKSELKNNKDIEINISDNGIGINPENLEKIFSPFFTTKSVGKGTGLGLSVCYGIINNMGGKMEVNSQVNIGTTFSISFPVYT